MKLTSLVFAKGRRLFGMRTFVDRTLSELSEKNGPLVRDIALHFAERQSEGRRYYLCRLTAMTPEGYRLTIESTRPSPFEACRRTLEALKTAATAPLVHGDEDATWQGSVSGLMAFNENTFTTKVARSLVK